MLSCKIPVPAVQPPVGAPGHQEHHRTHKWGKNARLAQWQVNNLGSSYTRLVFVCDDCGREYQGIPVYLPAPISQINVPGRV